MVDLREYKTTRNNRSGSLFKNKALNECIGQTLSIRALKVKYTYTYRNYDAYVI
jgi:hypothetical protein